MSVRDIEFEDDPDGLVGSTGRNLVAVIGIDHYQHWRRLENAVRDATGALKLFQEVGFEHAAAPLLDDEATAKAMWALVTHELTALGPDDSLVVFYAGHGATKKHRLGADVVKTGYLVPVDAQDEVFTWIDLEGWLRAVALLPAKHILVILDACHSGIALDPVIKWRDSNSWRDEPLSTLSARRSRRIITSALDDQVALDSGPLDGHSLFTGCLIEALTHGLRRSGSRVTTGSELGVYVQRRIESYPHSRQTPDFGTFAFDDRGEMVISVVDRQRVAMEMADEAVALRSRAAGAGVQDDAASINEFLGLSGPPLLGELGDMNISAESQSPKSMAGRISARWRAIAAVVVLTVFGTLAILAWTVVLRRASPSSSAAMELAIDVHPAALHGADGATVLWVDDHPENNERERQSLESLGVRFALVRSNSEALERVKVYLPDVIISDMRREKDLVAGYALLESLRQTGSSIPVIIYSESARPERRAEARRLGAFGCTSSPSELFEYVLAALRANP